MIDSMTDKLVKLLETQLSKGFDLNHIYLLLILTASLLIVEVIYEGWGNSSLKKIMAFNRSTRNDLMAWTIETISLYSFFSIAFSFGICYYLVGLIQNSIDINLNIPNSTVQFIVVFIVADLKNWISHFTFHKSNALWQLHSFHHSATQFTILTRQRGHFLESEIRRFFDVIPFVVFGAPISTYFLVIVLSEIHQMLLHSSSNSDWGFLGRYVIVSPAAHRVHHSIDPKHFNKNFGTTFIFWDIMFKTYHPKSEILTIGIPNNPFNKGYFRDVIMCQWLFLKATKDSIQNKLLLPLRNLLIKQNK